MLSADGTEIAEAAEAAEAVEAVESMVPLGAAVDEAMRRRRQTCVYNLACAPTAARESNVPSRAITSFASWIYAIAPTDDTS